MLHCVMCTVCSVMQAQFVCLIIKIVKSYTEAEFQKEQCKSYYLYTKQLLQGQIELISKPPAREPSLVSFSISNQNHITVHGFHVGLHPWLVSGLLSPSYGTQCTVYSIQCHVCIVYSVLSRLSNPKPRLGFKNNNTNHLTSIQNNTKQLIEGQFEIMLEPAVREPSLVLFSISNQNHITVHGSHVSLHPWLVSGVLSSS